MSPAETHPPPPTDAVLRREDLPPIYEDDGYDDMGDTSIHGKTGFIVYQGLVDHFESIPSLAVYFNVNLYFHPDDPLDYMSPDVMVVRPYRGGVPERDSYTVGVDGPMPVVAVEVLSERTAQQGDLGRKSDAYRLYGVDEYILVDLTGRYLPERLQLRRRRPDGTWAVLRDADGGLTSRLTFRIRIEPDGQVRVVNADTGRGYARPTEAAAEARRADEEARLRAEAVRRAEEEARRADEETRLRAEEARLRAEEARLRAEAEVRVRELEAELARLRNPTPPEPTA